MHHIIPNKAERFEDIDRALRECRRDTVLEDASTAPTPPIREAAWKACAIRAALHGGKRGCHVCARKRHSHPMANTSSPAPMIALCASGTLSPSSSLPSSTVTKAMSTLLHSHPMANTSSPARLITLCVSGTPSPSSNLLSFMVTKSGSDLLHSRQTTKLYSLGAGRVNHELGNVKMANAVRMCMQGFSTALTYNAAAWIELTPADFSASSGDTQEMDLSLSESGWLTCSHESGRISLWLPVERRGRMRARCGRRVVVGAKRGAVTILELPAAQS
jgi:hypothetical protein